ncbi:MAG: TlpA disulfide reductase family protein [Bacteroidetes bacterium]|nr:TlpA disulfide reductase family protein [Bacteroidota bacterium]
MKKQKPVLFFLLLILSALGMQAQPKQGQYADEVALPSVNGDTLRLSSLKGKVVLLDFWASWCGPCRESNKTLVKLYSKYKSKGFEIFGVSIDDNTSKWESAIKKDKITWLQVNDSGGWDAKIIESWRINAIPTSFLIDKEGKLLAMDLEGKELEKALKYLLEEK